MQINLKRSVHEKSLQQAALKETKENAGRQVSFAAR